MRLIVRALTLYPRTQLFICGKKMSTRDTPTVCVSVCVPARMPVCLRCEHAISKPEGATQTWISTSISSQYGADTPCWTQNRCTEQYQSTHHKKGLDSWDAYAFRPPLPDLSAAFLTSSVYMNMCHAENRAGAALFYAGVAGKGYPHQEVCHARIRFYV